MTLTILTPTQPLFEGDVKSINLPGMSGRFEILDHHAPIISALGKGIIAVTDTKGEKHKFSILKGFIEVLNNSANILVRI
ncbi:MAG: ATP synthase F1 subunit epsilon [Bacteroidota bacterium]|nr:ATP synthase F1 subunit epsilon [Bacteroidota bacterium]